jgi:hypothetical protein
MQDIRLVGNDGEYLNLETQDGDKFRLVLDESLRAAVKRDNSVKLDSISISPREIQDAVRAGATAEEVAAKYSAPIDYVEKFAQTVIDEIGHIIASAQSVRIMIAADRYSEASQNEFGEVVAERIARSGGEKVSWSAAKHEGLPWHVTVSFTAEGKDKEAVWSFDQRKLVLSPENETAMQFSAGDHSSAVSAPKLRNVEVIPEVTQVIELPTIASVSSIEELTRASVEVYETTEQVSETGAEPLTATADLLEALRKKRADATKADEVQKQPAADDSNVVELLEQVEAEEPLEDFAEIEEVAPEPIAPVAKKGRPSMPSWDEIVFGTKADD